MNRMLGVVACMAAMLVVVHAQRVDAQILGSDHDMTTATPAGPSTEICAYCHTPHGGDQTQGPLWNKL